MSNIICDKAGCALSLNDRVRVDVKSTKHTTGELWIGEITGFNPLAAYSIRVSHTSGHFGWYRTAHIRKLAARTLRIAEIKPVPFRRA